MVRESWIAAALTTALICGGCQGLAGPNWCNPGTTAVQKRRAERFDPYPQVTSRSEMTGVRPRDYDNPANDDYKPWSPWSPAAARR